jgi:two-component system phosphate regulon sensor histidine kinase PhoR
MAGEMEAISALVIVSLVGTAAYVAARGARRIRLLTRYAETVTGEREPTPLPPPSSGELGRLQTAVTGMAQEMRERLTRSRTQQHRLEAVLGGMVEGVIVIDAEGTVLLSNGRARDLLELPPDDGYIGRSLIELTRHPDLHDLVRWVMKAGEAESSTMREIELDGAQRHVLQVTATPIETAPEAIRVFVLVFHDISELKRLERIRRDFVANVSHELRTPLAAIAGYTETLLGGALDDKEIAPRFLGIIERHTERLGRLVDDLLILSDLELGRTELRRGEVWAGDVIEATFEVLRPKAEPAGISLEQTVEEGTPQIDADRDRLEQALLNLVDNAIKYTPRGGRVHVTARVLPSALPPDSQLARPGGFIEISVADTGIGVPPEDLPRLTERFYRVDKARSREMGGTGLGLAIVKHVVQAHGGWMGIESQLGRGTTVSLFFPAYAEADRKQHAAESA